MVHGNRPIPNPVIDAQDVPDIGAGRVDREGGGFRPKPPSHVRHDERIGVNRDRDETSRGGAVGTAIKHRRPPGVTGGGVGRRTAIDVHHRAVFAASARIETEVG